MKSTPNAPLRNSVALAGSKATPKSAVATGSGILGTTIPAPDRYAQYKNAEATGSEVAAFLFQEMKTNSDIANPKFSAIKKLFDAFKNSTGAPALRVVSLFEALYAFSRLVGYGKEWDQKKQIVSTWGESVLLFGACLEYDVWSNIHYGYIGRQIGFNPDLLLRAAGFAQAAEFVVPNGWLQRWLQSSSETSLGESLDDPVDQHAIRLGMQLSDDFGQKISLGSLLTELHGALNVLVR